MCKFSDWTCLYIVHQPWPQARAPGPDVRHLQGADLRSGDAALLRRGVLLVLCQLTDNLLWELSPLSGIIRPYYVFYSELSQLYQVSSMTDIIQDAVDMEDLIPYRMLWDRIDQYKDKVKTRSKIY